MSVRDAERVFGVTEPTIRAWRRKYGGMKTIDDKTYFMNRARQLGADDEAIAQWFGIERTDKVNMMLAGDKNA